MVQAQEGQLQDPLHSLPLAPQKVVWTAPKSGFLSQINSEGIGHLLIELGGGRKKATDTIDPGVGFLFHQKLGSKVTKGTPLVTVYLQQQTDANRMQKQFLDLIEISKTSKKVPKLLLKPCLK